MILKKILFLLKRLNNNKIKIILEGDYLKKFFIFIKTP